MGHTSSSCKRPIPPALTCPSVCSRKEKPAGGCSHVECPHRRALTAAPGRDSDGLIPPRGASTTGGY